MNFSIAADEAAFAASVRSALAGYAPRSWTPAAALDDRDRQLDARLSSLGLGDAAEAGQGFIAAAGLELGRALAPLAAFDELALGDVALAADGLARYAARKSAALDLREEGAYLVPLDGALPLPAIDSQGFARIAEAGEPTPLPDLRTWAAYHTAYLAGLVAAALALAVDHARARIQFGQPLIALAPVQQMLADAATLAQGLELVAWEEVDEPWPALLHAGEAAAQACEIAHQVHGAIGFALEAKVHHFFRRAHATRLFTRAVVRSVRRVEAAT